MSLIADILQILATVCFFVNLSRRPSVFCFSFGVNFHGELYMLDGVQHLPMMLSRVQISLDYREVAVTGR